MKGGSVVVVGSVVDVEELVVVVVGLTMFITVVEKPSNPWSMASRKQMPVLYALTQEAARTRAIAHRSLMGDDRDCAYKTVWPS